MLVALTLVLLSCFALNESKINYVAPERNENLRECINFIVRKYFSKYSPLTLVCKYDASAIIDTVFSLQIGITQRVKYIGRIATDYSYLMVNVNSREFVGMLPHIVADPSWNPSARFLITIKNITKNELKQVFDTLLKYHIINVLVLTGDFEPKLYSYNPFDNYGCGRRYDRIIEYGTLSESKGENLYPYKLVTGLSNCTFSVIGSHWPPYIIDPVKYNHTEKAKGIEEIIMTELGRLDNFSLKFSYNTNAEIFSVIEKNKSVVGPLELLQNGQADIMLGGLIHSLQRMKAFSYIDSHLPFADEFRFLVRVASPVPLWKLIYFEFDPIVWSAFLLSSLVYFLTVVLLVRPKDKILTLFTMFGSLMEESRRISGNYRTKFLFVLWIWFAYLVNTYYKSSLVSLTQNPPIEYQISSEEDLREYNLLPCVSNVVAGYLHNAKNMSFQNKNERSCYNFFDSIHTVSVSSDVYTVVMQSIYEFNEHQFFDKYGNPMIYSINQPLSKIIYAIYFYKGFPMIETLHTHVLRLRENGFISFHMRNLRWHNNMNYHFSAQKKKVNVLVPWFVLLTGNVISAVVFFLEIISQKIKPFIWK